MSNEAPFVIDAGAAYSPSERWSPARLLIEGNTIIAVGAPDSFRMPPGADRIDASECIAAPGFVDPHIHGCGGVDVMDGTYASLNTVSRTVARHGTTSFLATTVSSPPEVISTAVERLGNLMGRSFDGARPLGIHLEGPFINPTRRGTHKAAHLAPPKVEMLDEWMRRSGNAIRLLTLAPELPGIEAVLLFCRSRGAVAAMGHSDATFEEARLAAEHGVTYAVHTFNAMRPLSHRDPGIVGEVLADERIFAEIIADGVHVDPAVIRIFALAKQRERIILPSDGISATDMPDGTYTLGGNTVEVADGVCRDREGRLAGSTLTQELALRNFMRWTAWPLEDVLPALTCNPARALNLSDKGILAPGADADIVILDRSFRVMKTFVAGRLVFEREPPV